MCYIKFENKIIKMVYLNKNVSINIKLLKQKISSELDKIIDDELNHILDSNIIVYHKRKLLNIILIQF